MGLTPCQSECLPSDTGTRSAVTAGIHLAALEDIVVNEFIAAGFTTESVRRKTGIELPGYYRPAKKWDIVVIEEGYLVAAIEFKSQVGPSFGNNLNNRIEEAPGSTRPISLPTTTFPVESIFEGTSYKDRYQILCRRLIRERLYDAACFLTSSADPASPISEPGGFPKTLFCYLMQSVYSKHFEFGYSP